MDEIMNQDHTPHETMNLDELNEFLMHSDNETKETPYFKAINDCLDLINSSDKQYDDKGRWTYIKACKFCNDLENFYYNENEDPDLRKRIVKNEVALMLFACAGITSSDYSMPISMINKNHHVFDDLLKTLYELCKKKSLSNKNFR